jgi:hypothetical protein
MRILRTICPLLLGVCGIASANDSTDMMKFYSATTIMVAGTEIPAGDNTIQVLGASDGNVVLLVRSESGPQAFVLANRLNGEAPQGNHEAHVTLQRRENGYRLDQIWLTDHKGFELLRNGGESHTGKDF